MLLMNAVLLKMVFWTTVKVSALHFHICPTFSFFYPQYKETFCELFVKLYGNMGVWFVNSNFAESLA